MKKISNEFDEQIKLMYTIENLSAEEISKRTLLSSSTILRKLKEMEVNVIKSRHAGVFNIEEVIKLYKARIPIYVRGFINLFE